MDNELTFEQTPVNVPVTVNQAKIASAITMFSPEEVAVIKNTVAKNTTDTELAFFLFTCQSTGLNPLIKEIWCYKDNKGNLLIFAGRDGFLKKAQSHAKFGGMRSGVVRESDIWEVDIPNGKVAHQINQSKKDRGPILGAYCIVFRINEEPTVVWVDFESYNRGFSVWTSHPDDMILKVAEIKALKKAFGMSELQSEFDWKVKASGTVETISNDLIPDFKEGQR